MKRYSALAILSLISVQGLAADPMYRELTTTDIVRTEIAAQIVAVRSLGRKAMGGFQPVGIVLQLSRAHIDATPINRGDIVWLVSIANAGASTLTPVPDDLVWVRARDGAVVHLVGSNKTIEPTR